MLCCKSHSDHASTTTVTKLSRSICVMSWRVSRVPGLPAGGGGVRGWGNSLVLMAMFCAVYTNIATTACDCEQTENYTNCCIVQCNTECDTVPHIHTVCGSYTNRPNVFAAWNYDRSGPLTKPASLKVCPSWWARCIWLQSLIRYRIQRRVTCSPV